MSKNKIKFNGENAGFVVELREKVNNYFKSNHISKYGNSSILVKSVFMALLYFTPFVLMLTGVVSSFLLMLLFWIVMGIGMAGIGMVLMHDANHGSLFKNATANKIFGMSLYLLGGFPANWKYQHNTLHHGFTNIDGHDEDISPVGILRFSPHTPLRKIHRYQHLYAWLLYGLMTLSWVTLKDFKRFFNYKKDGAPLSGKNRYSWILTELFVSKIIYYSIILALPIVLLPIAWYWVVVFFIVMHVVSGIILSTIFQTAHVVPQSEYPLPNSDGAIEGNWAEHQMHTTTDFAPNNKLLGWFIGGLNFQVVHHLFPNISHVHYIKLSPIVAETALKYNIPYHVENSFTKALGKHYKMLKILGKK